MASSVNSQRTLSAGIGIKEWVPLNRWGPPEYAVVVTVSGTATWKLEGTLNRINRGETAVPFLLEDRLGTAITAIVDDDNFLLGQTPLEAMRLNQTAGAGTATLHVVQQGRVT